MRNKCTYCERTFHSGTARSKTSDHIIPQHVTKGQLSITVPVCLYCNRFKAGDLPIVFKGRLEVMQRNLTNIMQKIQNDLKVA